MKISPFILKPAFRYGPQTPWGGSELTRLFHKQAPDLRTGESLEMSVIPSLESTDENGTALSELIERYGVDLIGTAVKGEFPLLLKLIDARERLSVQVHPDDSYAALHEHKLGKTEAWVILACKPGASIVYGLKEGTDPEVLKAACESGAGVEELLNYAPVHAGDVFYIPAGMIHAIGEGIVLYEIQQSSYVTYRFYDWNRTDAEGNKRTLHIRQALDVARYDMDKGKTLPRVLSDPNCKRELLLDTPHFTLQRRIDCLNLPFTSHTEAFSVLTVLSDGTIEYDQDKIQLQKGTTIFIPAKCIDFRLTAEHCLLAGPAYSV
ncbi:MAG: class I mannose-6-phosphate isomerase [Oscillospiraceae bacterium]|nr:class I mannose-6-phosphate isomerase [Oscillospiraceae bacterium]